MKSDSMTRFHQILLIVSIVPLSWLGMMAVHELGHVAGAWWTGGTVAKVVLHPLTISRTDLSNNPSPLFVAWSGPILGAVLPFIAWGIGRAFGMPGAYLLRFFTGFCLIANGAYIGCGSFDGIGDAGDLLRHGAPIWQLWVFGSVTMVMGFFLWHRLGPRFGLGARPDPLSARVASTCFAMLFVLVGIEFLFVGD